MSAGVVRKGEYARMRNVSPESVRLWGKKGWLVLTPDGKVDVEASDRRIHALRRGRRRDGGEPPAPTAHEAAAARGREQRARADLAELERDARARRLVPREAVARAAKDRAVRLVDAVLSVPARISSRLALASEPREVEQILDGELRRTLEGVKPCEFAPQRPPAMLHMEPRGTAGERE